MVVVGLFGFFPLCLPCLVFVSGSVLVLASLCLWKSLSLTGFVYQNRIPPL
ncbi:unnamed protein product [Arabidopsis halleri]